jgi:predicted ester cyclase
MSEARDVVSRLNAALNAKDLEGARRVYAAGARLVTAGGRHIDIDGHDRMLEATFAAFPDRTLTTTRTVCDGDLVVTEEVMEGTHIGHFAGLAPTGRRVRLPLCHVTRVMGDRIVERVAYHDTAQILRQLTTD